MAKKDMDKYIEGIGRRKTSVARVRITESAKTNFIINEKSLSDYFPTDELQLITKQALELVSDDLDTKFSVSVLVRGGGIKSQAEAIRHGLARALEIHDEKLRKELKKEGYLKRDPRSKERKKPGLKKARKAPQWSKR